MEFEFPDDLEFSGNFFQIKDHGIGFRLQALNFSHNY